MARPPLLSVVIPTCDGADLLAACLGSLQQQALGPGDMEVIVVANGAGHRTLSLLAREFPWVRVIQFPIRQGFSKPVNAGWRAAQAALIFVLNDDTVCEAGCVPALLSAAAARPEAAFFAALMVNYDDPTIVNSAGHELMPHGMAVDRGSGQPVSRFGEPAEVFGACGGAVLYRRELLAELGGFDEDLWIVTEDADLDFRARLAGHRCYFVPQAVVRHHVSQSLGVGSSALGYYYSRNVILCLLKNLPPAFLSRYRRAVYLQLWKVMAAAVREGKAGSLWRAMRDVARLAPVMLAKRREQWSRLHAQGEVLVQWAARAATAAEGPATGSPKAGRLRRNFLSGLGALPPLLYVIWWFTRLARQDRRLSRRAMAQSTHPAGGGER